MGSWQEDEVELGNRTEGPLFRWDVTRNPGSLPDGGRKNWTEVHEKDSSLSLRRARQTPAGHGMGISE